MQHDKSDLYLLIEFDWDKRLVIEFTDANVKAVNRIFNEDTLHQSKGWNGIVRAVDVKLPVMRVVSSYELQTMMANGAAAEKEAA